MDPFLSLDEVPEPITGAQELDRLGLRSDPLIVNTEKPWVSGEKGFNSDIKAQPLAPFLEVPERNYLTRFVEDLFDDLGAELVVPVVSYGVVEFLVLAPNDFEA